MGQCSLILSNMDNFLDFHECGPKGLPNFECVPWKRFPLNYYNNQSRGLLHRREKTQANKNLLGPINKHKVDA